VNVKEKVNKQASKMLTIISILLPFLNDFFAFALTPNCPETSCNFFSNSCFLSRICSSFDLPATLFFEAKLGKQKSK
jgi:hypothetical protein